MKYLYKTLTAFTVSGLILFINAGNSSAQIATDNTVPHTVVLDPLLQPFYHGVASGDPLPDAIIIWTRVTPDTGSSGAITVDWRMATDTNMTLIVKNGTVTTDANVDYTVKIDVTGLQPATYYYYEFTVLGKNSLIGRTKTAPASAADIDSLRFAFVACSNYPYGYFNSYSAIKKGNDIDAVIHLGDYIYEYGDGYSTGTLPERPNEPAMEIIELSDYRTRYSHYRLDPDLRKLHQQYPWMIIWDDHETANDSYRDGADNHDTTTEGNWVDRKTAGMRAWTEWLPVRKPNPTDSMQIFRKISYGNLANIYLLDTRLFDRDLQNFTATNDTAHHLLGIAQRNWFYNELLNSAAQWNIVGQQVMMAPLSGGFLLDAITTFKNLKADMWEGYNAERLGLIDHVLNNNIKNVVILTGDIHTSWANDIPTINYVAGSPATGSAMVEFVTTSVTSPGLDAWLGSTINSQLATLIYPNNAHIKYVNLDEKGYNILDINKTRIQNDFYFVNTITAPNDSSQAKEYWFVNDNERALRKATSKTTARPSLTSVPFAPENPHIDSSSCTLSFTASSTADTGGCTGTASASISGGAAPYAYLWNTGATTSTLIALCTGSYCVTVTDTAGCAENGCIAVTDVTGTEEHLQTGTVILGAYPNPSSDYFVVQFYNEKSSQTRIKMIDITGKIIHEEQLGNISSGLHFYAVDARNLANGIYFLIIETKNGTAKQKLVKERK